MSTLEFRGFGGLRLEAESCGSSDDPPVLLIHGVGQTRAAWRGVARALELAGRQAISLDLRGHGGSGRAADGRYDVDAFAEDIRAVLSQLGSRPVVVAASHSGWPATLALGSDARDLAAGLVLVDLPPRARLQDERTAATDATAWDPRAGAAFDPARLQARLDALATNLALPVCFVGAAGSEPAATAHIASIAARLAGIETAEIDASRLRSAADRTDAFNALLLDFLERKLPRQAPEYRTGSDSRTLRDAMGCFATGVTVVTAMGADGRPVGLTASSFTSVSLAPPLLLVCIASSAGSAAALRAAGHFAVNVLQIGQQPTSNRFAHKGEERFAATHWHAGETGAPVLNGSLSSFECSRHAVHEAGDHFILVGQVVRASFEPHRDPLLYFRGRYRRLHFA